jgi:hypothetical protein
MASAAPKERSSKRKAEEEEEEEEAPRVEKAPRKETVAGAFWNSGDASFTTRTFSERPPWPHRQAHTPAFQDLDFEEPWEKSDDADVEGDAKHMALCALMTGSVAVENAHASWKDVFKAAQAYIDACMGKAAEETETFTYLFTCALPMTD